MRDATNPSGPIRNGDGEEREMECPNCGTVSGEEIRRVTGEFGDGTYVETFSCRLCADGDDGPRRETVICERYIRTDGSTETAIDPE